MDINLFIPKKNPAADTPIVNTGATGGFPSPADGYADIALDLNKELVRNPSSTFFARVEGGSMHYDGIDDGDLLVIDKSVKPYDKCMAVCVVNGDFILKKIQFENNKIHLIAADENTKPIIVNTEDNITIWGVVRYAIKKIY